MQKLNIELKIPYTSNDLLKFQVEMIIKESERYFD